MNKIFLIGNTTRDAECGTTNTGLGWTRLTLAVTRRGSKDESDFFNIVAWRKTAEILSGVKKGNKLAVVGSVQIREYEGKSGEKRTSVDVIADEVQFLTPKSEQVTSKLPASCQQVSQQKYAPVDDEQLPF